MSEFLTYNTLIVLTGTSLLGACSGMVGTFAVLRRRALAGDALAHASLPGVCLAFLVVNERWLPALLAGALLTGLLGIVLISLLRAGTRIKEDTAIGIVLSVFYGLGVVLLSYIQRSTTVGNRAGLKSFILGKTAGMIFADVLLIGGVSLICLCLILLLYKEFQLVAFDPGFAAVQGWPAVRIDLLLMGMIALTVVIGLPAVGVVLMAAALIIPSAAARFWTERLGYLLILSSAFGVIIGAAGSLASAYSEIPAGPAIVLVGTGIFLLSVLIAPKRGFLARLWREKRFQNRVADFTLLELLYNRLDDPSAGLQTRELDQLGISSFQASSSIHRLLGGNWIEYDPRLSGYRLTAEGMQQAVNVVRTHRLWEVMVTDFPGPHGDWTEWNSTSADEKLPPDLRAELENRLRHEGRFPELPENCREVPS